MTASTGVRKTGASVMGGASDDGQKHGREESRKWNTVDFRGGRIGIILTPKTEKRKCKPRVWKKRPSESFPILSRGFS